PVIVEKGGAERALIATCATVSVIAAIDSTIVTVALPYMQGTMNADSDEISWVVTMFVIGQAIAVGLAGPLSRILGRRRLAVASVAGFVLMSVLCGLAPSLEVLVVCRFLQGFAGGPLIPTSQAILFDHIRLERRSSAIGLWAMGVMGGPALGP